MPQYTLYAFAKINRYLDIFEPLPDGMHPIHSIFQSVSWPDILSIQTDFSKGHFELSCNIPDLSEPNILRHVWDLIQERVPFGVSIHLTKQIPMGAGLGGGSSDAAAFLSLLSHLVPHLLPPPLLSSVAHQVGSDVPYFLRGGTSLVQGTGDTLRQLSDDTTPYYLVIVPPIHLNTAQRYQRLDLLSAAHTAAYSPIETVDPESYGLNRFESFTFSDYPIYSKIADVLGHDTPLHLSGSGSAAYVACDSLETLSRCYTTLHDHFPSLRLMRTCPVPYGSLHIARAPFVLRA